jgi:hypothetical protein
MKHLVGKSLQKKVKFLGEDVLIRKLNVAQVMEIQELSKGINAENSDADSMAVLLFVIKAAVEGAADIDEADLKQFPLDELSTLSNSILEYSGLGAGNAQKS